MNAKKIFSVIFFWAAITVKSYAVRPFITDDAAIALRRQILWETWGMFDKYSGQHWTMLAYGLHKNFELSLGGVYGYDKPQPGRSEFSYALPVMQGKFLFREIEPDKLMPGIGFATGTALPAGKGALVPDPGAYGFFTFSQCFGKEETVTTHLNLGCNYVKGTDKYKFVPYWGLGVQLKTYKGLHLVAEVISDDPYDPTPYDDKSAFKSLTTGLACQIGFRHFISENCQFDVETGQSFETKDFWIGVGLRFVITKIVK
jgi:hypothetical protein